jgi:GT2 family glycosyltransferase
MNPSSLKELYSNHTGKTSDKWTLYIDTYDQAFLPIKNDNIRLLEIGIQNGGSLEIWSKYFERAKILVGCDVNPDCAALHYEDPRIELVIGNANDDASQLAILKKSPQFDLIIDDGSHRSADIIQSFTRYFSHLAAGGLYVVEDLHCSYWGSFGGGLFHPYSAISFFKRLSDILNFEHWGIPSQRSEIVRSFFSEYNCTISSVELAQLHSVEFLNSICIVRKKAAQENELGPRVIAGADAKVFPEILSLKGRLASGGVETVDRQTDQPAVSVLEKLKRPDETTNEWNQIHPLPEERQRQMAVELNRLNAELEANTAISLEKEQLDIKLKASKNEIDAFKRKHSDAIKALESARATNAKSQKTITDLQNKKKGIESALQSALQVAAQHQAVSEALYASTSWRVTAPLRRATQWWTRQRDRANTLGGALLPGGGVQRARIRQAIGKRVLRREYPSPGQQVSEFRDYNEWINSFDVRSDADRALIKAHIEQAALPEIVIFWILENANASAVKLACASLQAQLHQKWRCTIVGENEREIRARDGISQDDQRISYRSKLNREETLDLPSTSVLIITGEGTLAEHATYLFATVLREGGAYAFSDYDLLSQEDTRHSPKFLPAFSRDFTTPSPVTLAEPTTELIRAVFEEKIPHAAVAAEIRSQFENSASTPTHLPFILFHSRKELSFQGRELSEPALQKTDDLQISIIIPTRDRLDFLKPCVDSILEKTEYARDRYEIIVVDNGSTEQDLLHYLDLLSRDEKISVIRDPRKFNYSRLNNEAAKTAKGELLAFVNNDIVVNDPLWLRKLAFHARQKDVGAVGSKLLYPDMTVQHGGIILGIQGVAAHAHHNLSAADPGYLGLNGSTHAISAVTGACLMVRHEVFDRIGGFDENLAVAFNDVLLCLNILDKGYRNIYVGDPLLIHFESKTRGFDDTEAKQKLFRREARYARSKHRALFKNDPYYNENLSLEKAYELAFPPRMEKPWQRFRRESSGKLRILMLSSTHQIGHGVAVVVDLQARHLASLGHKVFVGGPLGAREFAYENCQRVYLNEPKEAAIFATQYNMDCVVMHTPPFYSAARWLGSSVKTIAYDYGEPDPDFFPDAHERRNQLFEKALCLEMADEIHAISEAVKNEAPHERVGVIPLGNSHLATWNNDLIERRANVRAARQWDDKIVILNVCRFHEGERYYKGVDEYCALRGRLQEDRTEDTAPIVFCLAGKGSEDDVEDMQARGLSVFANVSDEELIDLYCAADIYVNFSKWEGYNLGIGQALAMGLPVLASDIPAHRAFKVFTTNDLGVAVEKLREIAKQPAAERTAILSPWAQPLHQFSEILSSLCIEVKKSS